jgi:hypothetical protein
MRRHVVAGLVASLACSAWPVQSANRAQLTVHTEPAGAIVYLNGRVRGVTPLQIEQVEGDQRVNLVKPGYLDNRQVVRLRSGDTRTLRVALTPGAVSALQVDSDKQPEKRGGSKKALWIGVAALGAGAAAYLALRDTNKAPTASVAIDSGGTALAGATRVSFSGAASADPDGDPLTYSWDFGDGTNGTGQTTTHIYNAAGSFNVTLTVSDGSKTATAAGSVSVRSLTGVWTGNLGSATTIFFTFTLVHNGSTITGTYSDPANGSGSIEGVVTAPRSVSMTNRLAAFRPGFWNASLDGGLDRMTGSVDWFQSGVQSFVLTRR